MNSKEKISPHKITKPIQLLAAWLTGLILVNTAFLTASIQITQPSWIPATLVIASILNVPLFLIAIFLLQTRFRPEMQEDTFYSKYLESKTGNSENEISIKSFAEIREDIAKIEKVIAEKVVVDKSESEKDAKKIKWSSVTIALNKRLSIFDEILKTLAKCEIPIHEIFGSKLTPEIPFKVAIGDGFDVNQINELVNSLSLICAGWISYARYRKKIGQYDNIAIIGAYGSYEHGIEFDKLKTILEEKDLTITELYKVLGKEELSTG